MRSDPESPFQTHSDDLVGDPGSLLLRCANLYKRHQRAAMASLGVTPTQQQLLRLLRLMRPGHPLRVADLARALRLHPVLIGRLLRLFEERGWVQRQPDPTDGRASLIELTGPGRARAEEILQALSMLRGDFFAPLKHEEKGFCRLLTSVLREHDPEREASKSVRERREERRRHRLGLPGR